MPATFHYRGASILLMVKVMTTLETSKLVGKVLHLTDARTGNGYLATVSDVKMSYGRVRVICQTWVTSCAGTWFEPTRSELDGATDQA